MGLLFFALLIQRSWSEVVGVFENLHIGYFALSIIAALLYNTTFCLLFQVMLRKYGFSLSFSRTAHMFFWGQIAKYIPGRFWSILYQASFLKRRGATSAMLFANLDLTAVSVLHCTAVAGFLLLYLKQSWIAIGVFAMGLLVFWQLSKNCWIARIAKPVLARLRVPSERVVGCSASSDGKEILLIGVAAWMVYLAANFLLMKAAFDFAPSKSAIYIAYFSIAWVVGVLSFVVPAGIGIREAVFIFLIQSVGQGVLLGPEMLVSIAVVYRAWHIFLDLGGYALGFVMYRRLRLRSEEGTSEQQMENCCEETSS